MQKVTDKIEKIVINAGVGRFNQMAHFKEKVLTEIEAELAKITGQKAVRAQAKKSIAGFKIREADIVGLKTTLRGKRMEDFFQKVVNIALPRVKDFRGLEESVVDEAGNLNIGLQNQYVFPEIDPNNSKISFGMQITATAKRKGREEMIDFYREYKVPLKRE